MNTLPSTHIQRLLLSIGFLAVLVLSSSAISATFPAEFEPRRMNEDAGRLIAGPGEEVAFGERLQGLGDIDGDGFTDIVMGGSGSGPDYASRSYILYGSASSASFDVSADSLIEHQGVLVESGWLVKPAGDINNDSYDDWLLRTGNGRQYLVYGRATRHASPLQIETLADHERVWFVDSSASASPSTPPGTTPTTPEFVGIIEGIGDFDGDGFDDLALIGTGSNQHAVTTITLLRGTTGGLEPIVDIASVSNAAFRSSATARYRVSNNNPNIWSGVDIAIGGGGDINDDGLADLLVTMAYADQRAGEIHVVFGNANGLPPAIERGTLDGSNGFSAYSSRAQEPDGYMFGNIGRTATLVRDLNGDGVDDLLVAGNEIVHVVYGLSSGWTAELDMDSTDIGRGYQVSTSPQSLRLVVDAGDINGDNFNDWTLSYGNHTAVIYGAEQVAADIEPDTLDGVSGFRLRRTFPFDDFSTLANRVGDVNGDGVDDLLVGNAYEIGREDVNSLLDDPTLQDAAPRLGLAYVIFGQTDVDQPASVQNLYAALAPEFIDVRWQKPAAGSVSGYDLYRDGTLLATLDADTVFFSDNSTAHDVRYTYEVFTVGESGKRSAAMVLSVRNDAVRYPVLGGDVYSTTLAELFWVFDNRRYRIYRDNVLVGTLNAQSWLDDNYDPSGHRYFIETEPRYGETNTVRSSEFLLPQQTGTRPPAAPSNINLAVYTATMLELFWERASYGTLPLRYEVLKDDEVVGTTNGNSFVYDAGTDGSYYASYGIVTIDANGIRSAITRLNADIYSTYTATRPAAPNNVTRVSSGLDTLTLTWDVADIGTPPIGYEVHRRGSFQDDFEKIATTLTPVYVDTGLSINTRYQYKITSLGDDGRRSDSAYLRTRTDGGPNAPNLTSATAYGPRTVEVFWSRADGAEMVYEYEVYRNGVLIATTIAISLMEFDLQPDTEYRYTVYSLAAYGSGRSVASPVAVVRTPAN